MAIVKGRQQGGVFPSGNDTPAISFDDFGEAKRQCKKGGPPRPTPNINLNAKEET